METVTSILVTLFYLIVGIIDALLDEETRPGAIFCLCWIAGLIAVDYYAIHSVINQLSMLF